MNENVVNTDHSAHYTGQKFSREELTRAMSDGYAVLIAFVRTPEFRAAYLEMMSLPPEARPMFVKDVFLNPDARVRRGIRPPKDVLIQTSAFGDRRPTLFCVKIFLPEKFHKVWENVNLTFDNEFEDDEVSRDPSIAWRRPLPVGLQNTLISSRENPEIVPDIGGLDPTWPKGLGESTQPPGWKER